MTAQEEGAEICHCAASASLWSKFAEGANTLVDWMARWWEKWWSRDNGKTEGTCKNVEALKGVGTAKWTRGNGPEGGNTSQFLCSLYSHLCLASPKELIFLINNCTLLQGFILQIISKYPPFNPQYVISTSTMASLWLFSNIELANSLCYLKITSRKEQYVCDLTVSATLTPLINHVSRLTYWNTTAQQNIGYLSVLYSLSMLPWQHVTAHWWWNFTHSKMK